jgi:hypothetical protein
MEETEHKSFFRPRKSLALLPLAVLTAGVLWHIARHRAGAGPASGERTPAAAAARPFARPARPAAREEAAKNISALDIQGSPEFKGQVTGALKLIHLADRETFLFIKKCLYIIRNENKTDLYLDGGQPVAAISSAHAFRSMPWCAGIIAHQAFHSYAKFSAGEKQKFVPPPPGTSKNIPVAANPMIFDVTSLDSVLDVEEKASAFQIKILEAVGASRAEIRSVQRRAPRDFSTGHDGNYSLTP